MIMYGAAGMLLALAHPASGDAPNQQASSRPSSESQAAAAVVDRFHEALARGDTVAAAALMSDDALIYESGGVERSKAEFAVHHLPADAAFAKAVSRALTRRQTRAEGGLAWVASEATIKGKYKGRSIHSRSVETMVLRRAGPSWLIVHVHWSSKPVK